MRPENKYFIPIFLTGNSTSFPVVFVVSLKKKKWESCTENAEMFDKHFSKFEKNNS